MSNPEKPTVGITADEDYQAAEREALKLEETQEDHDWAWLMSTPNGRRVVSRILVHCKVGAVRLNVSNDRQEAFDLGEQNVGHWIAANVRRVSLAGVRLMEDEEIADERNRNRRARRQARS